MKYRRIEAAQGDVYKPMSIQPTRKVNVSSSARGQLAKNDHSGDDRSWERVECKNVCRTKVRTTDSRVSLAQ